MGATRTTVRRARRIGAGVLTAALLIAGVGCSASSSDAPGRVTYPELASGRLEGLDWTFQGEQRADQVCIQVIVSQGRSSGGGPDCDAPPKPDELGAASVGGSFFGDQEVQHYAGVVGADVDSVEFVPAPPIDSTDLVWIPGERGVKFFALLHPPSFHPKTLRLLGPDGEVLYSQELLPNTPA